MKLAFKTILLAGTLASQMATEAQASSYLYTLDQTNADSVQMDGVPYLTVRIEDGVYGADSQAIKFTVDIIDTAFTKGGNFGIDAFGFNKVAGQPAVGDSNIVQLHGWETNAAPPEVAFDGFGKFLGAAKSDTGNNRLETLEFWITGVNGDSPLSYVAPSSGTAGQGNAWFAAHVAGFTISGSTITSAFYGAGNGSALPPVGGEITAVPLPGAFWLFGTALAGLRLTRKSRQA